MIKANVLVDFPKWKKKIKDPKKYLQRKLNKLNKISSFKNKNQEFSILLTNNKKMRIHTMYNGITKKFCQLERLF